MLFEIFQPYCKHAQYALVPDTVREFEFTCRHPRCIPLGQSWGVCDEDHCPAFRASKNKLNISNIYASDPATGEVLFTLSSGTIKYIKME